jgi:GDSL-like Lipase/Acylhydrolase family
MPDRSTQPGHPRHAGTRPEHAGTRPEHAGTRPGHRAGACLSLRRRTATASTVLAAAGITLLLTACSVTGSTIPVAAAGAAGVGSGPQGSYVALGDSYTAGPDIPDPAGATAGCEQSSSSYPYLVAQSLRLNLTDMSCSSATIASLSAPQPTDDGTNAPQLSALSPATRLVTIGIGGNDVDWAGIITRCTELDLIPALIPGVATSDVAPCQDYYTSGGTDQIQQRIQVAAGDLASALVQIRQLAPHAHVYVVGYPDLLPAAGDACAHTLGITQGDVYFLNNEEIRLNSMLRQDARAAGDGYVDTYTPSQGHDACSAPASRWIEPLLPASPAAPLHPNAVGEQGIADAVIYAITGTA